MAVSKFLKSLLPMGDALMEAAKNKVNQEAAKKQTQQVPQFNTSSNAQLEGIEHGNVKLTDQDLGAINYLAKTGGTLEHWTPQKQEIYNQYSNPQPTYKQYEAPSYSSQYQSQIDAALDSLLNAKEFEYDYNTDPNYKAYKESYNREGNRAMQNAMSEAQALNGGRATSFAVSAGQQQQNYYNAQLNDKIPELYNAAYNMYMNDLANERQNLSALQGLEQNAYNQYANDRAFGYGQVQDENNYNYQKYADTRNYNRGVLESDIARAQNTRDYNRGVFESDRTYDRNVYEDNRNYDRSVFESDRGYNRGVFESDRGYNRGVFESDRGFNYNAGQDSIQNALNREKFEYQKVSDAAALAAKSEEKYGLTYTQKYAQARDMLDEKEDLLDPNGVKLGSKKTYTQLDVYNRIMDIAQTDEEAVQLLTDVGIDQKTVEKLMQQEKEKAYVTEMLQKKNWDPIKSSFK